MENSIFSHVTRYDVTTKDCCVVRIGVLAPLALGDSLPVVIEHVLVRPDFHNGNLKFLKKGDKESQLNLLLRAITHYALHGLCFNSIVSCGVSVKKTVKF
jgi:hypothetical protein